MKRQIEVNIEFKNQEEIFISQNKLIEVHDKLRELKIKLFQLLYDCKNIDVIKMWNIFSEIQNQKLQANMRIQSINERIPNLEKDKRLYTLSNNITEKCLISALYLKQFTYDVLEKKKYTDNKKINDTAKEISLLGLFYSDIELYINNIKTPNESPYSSRKS